MEVVFTHSDRVAHAHVHQPAGLAQVVHRGCAHAQSHRYLANGEKGTDGRGLRPWPVRLYHYWTKRSAIRCNSWRSAARVTLGNPLNFQRFTTIGYAMR
jgi:hypothetical protein